MSVISNRLLVRLGLVALGALIVVLLGTIATIAATPDRPRLPVPLPTATPRMTTGINTQVRGVLTPGSSSPVLATSLYFQSLTHPGSSDPSCRDKGLWTLEVNLQDLARGPRLTAPSAAEWKRAARALHVAEETCPAPARLSWGGHDASGLDKRHWRATVPATAATRDGGAALGRYALAHGVLVG